MAMKKGVDEHRTALALVQAAKTGDVNAVRAVVGMLEDEDQFVGFLTALATMVFYAHDCDPRRGWKAFVDAYAASLDQVEAKLDGAE